MSAQAEATYPGRNGGTLRPKRTAGPGLPRGTKQRATLIGMALTSLERLGGIRYLERMGNSKCPSDRSAYLAFIKTLIPLQHEASVDQTLTVKIVKSVGYERLHVPAHGTCVIGESERVAPIAAPIAAEGTVEAEGA